MSAGLRFYLEALGENLFPGLFQRLPTRIPSPGPAAPPPPPPLHSHTRLRRSWERLSAFKDLCGYIGPAQIIRGDYCQGPELNHICKVPLPHEVPYSQVPGRSLVGHSSACHTHHPHSIQLFTCGKRFWHQASSGTEFLKEVR